MKLDIRKYLNELDCEEWIVTNAYIYAAVYETNNTDILYRAGIEKNRYWRTE